MASFATHINAAVIGGGTVVAAMHASGFLSTEASVSMLFLTVVGTVLPDLDSDSSKPIRITLNIISILLPLLLILLVPQNIPLLYMGLFWFFSSLILHLLFFKIVLKLTKHRGIFHTIPMGVLFGELFFALLHYQLGYTQKLASIGAVFVVFGCVLHLVLDEIYSVNLMGMSLKRSFGSALKLYSGENIFGSVALYIAVFTLGYLLPWHLEILRQFWESLFSIRFF